MIMQFLSFLSLMWCITLIDLCMLNHPCDESHMVVVYDLFSVLLDLVCYYFVENFCIYIHQRYWWILVHFLVVSLSGFSVRMRVIHKMSLGVFPLQSFEEFEKDWYTFFFAYLVEVTCEAIWSFVGSFFCYKFCFISSD